MKTKSKVTSIRVEPELYEKFKSILESQNKQVSGLVCEFIDNQVMINEAVQELIARCDGFIKPVSEWKGDGREIDHLSYGDITKKSKEEIQQLIKDQWWFDSLSSIEDMTMYFTGVSYNGYLNFILVEKMEWQKVVVYKFVSIEECIRMLQNKETTTVSKLPDGRYAVQLAPVLVSKRTLNRIKDIKYPTIEQIEEAEKENSK